MALTVQQRNIIRVTIILSVLTIMEFVLAGTKDAIASGLGWEKSTVDTLVLLTFLILTVFKAYYIVSEFMHLGHELRRMILSILLPFIFIVWLIIGMIIEGDYYGRITKEEYGYHPTTTPTVELMETRS
jgi:cytochrome c oxidase subunit IV